MLYSFTNLFLLDNIFKYIIDIFEDITWEKHLYQMHCLIKVISKENDDSYQNLIGDFSKVLYSMTVSC